MKRLSTFRVIIIMLLVVTATAIPIQAQAPDFGETFDDPALPGWEHTPGTTVVDGALQIEPGNFAFHGGEWGDMELSVRLQRSGPGPFVISTAISEASGYHCAIGEDFIALQREAGGDLVELSAATIDPLPEGEWFQITIAVSGGSHIILLNDSAIITHTDPDPLSPGGVAFESASEATITVDDLSIIVTGEPPEGPPEEPPGEQPPIAPPQDTGDLTWVRTGGPLGGLGYDVRMRPDDPNIMYVTDAWAGAHISTDDGQTWFPSNDGITTRAGESGDAIPVFCLTIDPHDYDTIWVGTQNVRGIFKSTDGGYSWEQKDNGVVEYEGITFRGITIDPRSPDIVYAAAEISSWLWSETEVSGREFDKTMGVIYKTTDGGENWTAIWRGQNLARYIWVDPRDSDVLYISTGIFDREAANSDHTTNTPGGEGVLKSTDGGQTWQQVNTGITNLYVGTLFMHPEDPDTLLAGTGNNAYPDGSGAFLTTDGGASWEAVIRDENINAVEFALSDPNIAYAGSADAIYRSEDGGHTWDRVSGEEGGWGPPGVLAGFPIDFQVDPRDPNRIFVNNYGGGNFVSADGGRTWAIASDGYTGAQARDIAVDPTDPNRVFVAARSGIFGSVNGGTNWTGLSRPPVYALEWNVVALDPDDPQHILAGTNWEGLLVNSSDSGQSWQIVGPRLPGGMGWSTVAFALSDPQTVYGGTSAFFSAGTFSPEMDASGIYVSHDSGATWEAANDTHSSQANVNMLAVDLQDPQVVYAATNNAGLLKSTDGGANWTILNQGLPGSQWFLSVAVHPQETNRVYTGLAGSGLYRSDDGGMSWRQSSAGLNPESAISDIAIDPTDPQIMYISDRMSGVYRSTDGGATWMPINSNLRTRAVGRLDISSDGQYLYAATEGEGVFLLDLTGPPQPGVEPVETEPSETEPVETEPDSSGGGICPGAALLPLALGGLVTLYRRKKR